jgi:hypothetical protein
MARLSDYLNRETQAPAQQEIGIGKFTSLVRIRETYRRTASAPSTPVEDGSVVNDHIILDPLTISIEGSVSDVHLRASPVLRAIRQAQAEIGNITSQYAPARTQTQLTQISALANDALDAARRIDALLDAGEQIGALFGNQDASSKTNRQYFIDYIEELYEGKQLISIDMPYRRLDNMVITSLTINYDNEIDASDFTLEAQKVRMVELQFAQVQKRSGGTSGQTDAETNKGAQAPEPVECSLWANAKGYATGKVCGQ